METCETCQRPEVCKYAGNCLTPPATEELIARRSAAAGYRLLNFDDEIEGSDEFLEDDAVTWTRLDIQHRWNVGGWWHANLKPMRRKISSDNVQGDSVG